jgi:F-type H+-transporting ATPase subunit b
VVVMLAILLAQAEDETGKFILPHKDELIWATIAFVILFAFLAKAVFPQVRKMLEQRSERIRGQLQAAEDSKSEADRVLDQYRQQLGQARQEAQGIIEEAKRTAESLRRDLVARAEREAQEIVSRARAEVTGERDRALAELRTSVGELTIELTKRVIQRELANEPAQRAYVDQTIAELARVGDGQRQ